MTTTRPRVGHSSSIVRVLGKTLALASAGALCNVGLALLIACRSPGNASLTEKSYDKVPSELADAVPQGWLLPSPPARWVDYTNERWHGTGFDALVLGIGDVPPGMVGTSKYDRQAAFYAAGWPMRSMSCIALWPPADAQSGTFPNIVWKGGAGAASQIAGSRPTGFDVRVRPLPLHPVAWPFVFNSGLYAGLLLLAIWTPRAILRDWRKNKGRCPNCGYDSVGAVGKACPECGTPWPS